MARVVAVRRRRTTWRRLGLGLATVLGLGRRGYFLPYRYAGAVPDISACPPYRAVEAHFAARGPAFAAALDALAEYADALRSIGTPRRGSRARWDQDWFPRLDAALAYLMVRRHRPRRLIEIGSGHSTRFVALAARDGGLDTAITAIDPAPRADLAGAGITLRREIVQRTGLGPFRALGPGDMLMVDSSHILMPGSDVDVALNAILPLLPAGALVHFHDIFLPDDYPAAWAWRGYNEQTAIASLLGSGYEVLFASHYVATRMAGAVASSVAGSLPLVAGAHESGLWLRKTGPVSHHGEMTSRDADRA